MMYSTNIRNLNPKYFIFMGLKNDKIWKNLENWNVAYSEQENQSDCQRLLTNPHSTCNLRLFYCVEEETEGPNFIAGLASAGWKEAVFLDLISLKTYVKTMR
jgi:hypothetical protein